MWSQKWPPAHQSKAATCAESNSFTSTLLRNLQKRSSRRFWLVLCLLTSAVFLICFPTRTTLYTWQAQSSRSDQGPGLGWSSVTISVKDGSHDWQRKTFEQAIPNFDIAYHPKTPGDFNEAFGSYGEATRAHKTVENGDQLVPVDLNSGELQIFQRLVVKKPPPEKFEPLPSMSLEPNLKYENVTPNLHPLTNELDKTKFLTYLPHSGFHNQRIQVNNAFRLAKLLNRTLILPAFRLGTPLPWKNSTSLAKALDDDQKKYYRLEECLNSPPTNTDELERHSLMDQECNYDSHWTSAQVGYIINIEELIDEVPIVDRIDLRESWLWETLKLSPGEWLEVPDDSRYSYQIYESVHTKSIDRTKYDWRLNIADLAKFRDIRLLSFGSLFGTERVILNSPEMELWNLKVKKNQFLSLPLLERISDRIADQLGGRGNYIGLHLRVGNANFKTQASKLALNTFNEICQKVLRLDQKLIDDLLLKHELMKQSPNGNRKKIELETASESLPINNPIPKYKNVKAQYESRRKGFETRAIKKPSQANKAVKTEKHRISQASLRCHGSHRVEKDSQLDKLNTPIYISTDVSVDSIRTDPNLRIISDSFPCVFSFDDLTELIQAQAKAQKNQSGNQRNIKSKTKKQGGERDSKLIVNDQASQDDFMDEFFKFSHLKSNLDGLNLDRFLFPMLESMIVSKGSHIIGTPGSTFSNYAVKVLHPVYRSNKSSN